jgi:hypothetical protein
MEDGKKARGSTIRSLLDVVGCNIYVFSTHVGRREAS